MGLKEFFRAARPENCIIAGIGVFVGSVIAFGNIPLGAPLGLAMLSAALITAAGNMVNDYFDEEIDIKLRKKSHNLGKGELLSGAMLLFLAGIMSAYTINSGALAIAIMISALLIIYSAFMQNYKYIGNFVVAIGTASTIIYGASINANFTPVILPALCAMLANVSREIIKDNEDISGDRGRKKTLPMILGHKTMELLIAKFYAVAILAAIVAFLLGYMRGMAFLALLAISAMIFGISWFYFYKKDFTKAKKFSKYGMVAALLAFLAGAL